MRDARRVHRREPRGELDRPARDRALVDRAVAVLAGAGRRGRARGRARGARARSGAVSRVARALRRLVLRLLGEDVGPARAVIGRAVRVARALEPRAEVAARAELSVASKTNGKGGWRGSVVVCEKGADRR